MHLPTLNFYTTNDGQARNKLSGRNTAHSGRSESSLRVNGDCQEELTKKLSPPLMKDCEKHCFIYSWHVHEQMFLQDYGHRLDQEV